MASTRTMTLAVTGGSGLIGSRLLLALRERGMAVRVLTRKPLPDTGDAHYVHGDLGDPKALGALVDGAAHLVHLAGLAHTTLPTEEDRQRARDTNVGGTERLLEAAVQAGVQRAVVASSAHVYAGQTGIGLKESSPTEGDSVYGEMKLAVEAAAARARASGLQTIVIRPCITYGPGVRFNIASLMRAVRKRYYFHTGGVDPLRSFLSVDAAAAAILHLLLADVAEGTYNVADREPVRLSEWVNGLADRMGVRHPKRLPMPLLRAGAAAGSLAKSLKLPAPLTKEALRKLTASFSLDVSALAATGFVWPSTTNHVLDEMVQAAAK